MPAATFRFYEELNDFLPPQRRKREFELPLHGPASVKDMIESAGVPHTEIDLILANGRSVGFGYGVADGDRISVYPVFESMDISPVSVLRPEPLRRTRFVLDTHLGKLSRYLRLLGFDSLYRNDYADATLAEIASSGDKRILLTRDLGLLKRKCITHGYFVRDTDPDRQMVEVLDRFDLRGAIRPFTRCTHCNHAIGNVERESVRARVPRGVFLRYAHFAACDGCGRVYWPGSHYDGMRARMARWLDNRPERLSA